MLSPIECMKMLKHTREVALARIHERSVTLLVSKKVIIIFVVLFLEKWVELVLLDYHADQGLLIRLGATALDARSSLKEAVKDATQGLNLVNRLKLGNALVLLVHLGNRAISLHHFCYPGSAD